MRRIREHRNITNITCRLTFTFQNKLSPVVCTVDNSPDAHWRRRLRHVTATALTGTCPVIAGHCTAHWRHDDAVDNWRDDTPRDIHCYCSSGCSITSHYYHWFMLPMSGCNRWYTEIRLPHLLLLRYIEYIGGVIPFRHLSLLSMVWYGIVGFNVPIDTL